MVVRRVPPGIKVCIALALYVLSFLLLRPSDPATQGQIVFWKKAAGLFGQTDVEGFVGIALIASCTVITVILYLIIIRIISTKMNKNSGTGR